MKASWVSSATRIEGEGEGDPVMRTRLSAFLIATALLLPVAAQDSLQQPLNRIQRNVLRPAYVIR